MHRSGAWRDGHMEAASDLVAEEMPVALRYQGTPYVVMLATPAESRTWNWIHAERGAGRAPW